MLFLMNIKKIKITLRKFSKKRQSQMNEYKKIRVEFLKANPNCAVCNCEATDVHHVKGRIGDLLTDIHHFLAVCRICHVRIENNPEWAKEKGYSKSRLT